MFLSLRSSHCSERQCLKSWCLRVSFLGVAWDSLDIFHGNNWSIFVLFFLILFLFPIFRFVFALILSTQSYAPYNAHNCNNQ